MARAGVYCRVSGEGQRDNYSLPSQDAAIREHIAAKGYDLDERHVYHEVYTGAEIAGRPELSRLRAAIRAGELDVVIVHHFDRLSRDPEDRVILRVEARQHNTTWESVLDPRADSDEGRLVDYIAGYAAKVQRLRTREATQRGLRGRVQDGKLIPSNRPLYGYDFADPDEKRGKSRYVENAETAAVVRRIFAEAAAGATLRGIARGLTEDGIPTPTGLDVWKQRAVAFILHHPAYQGEAFAYVTRNEKVRGSKNYKTTVRPAEEWVRLPEGTIPALVEPATWRLVQERLERNRSDHEGKAKRPEESLLRGGFVVCGHCGDRLYIQQVRGVPMYRCERAARLPGSCNFHTIKTEELDRDAWRGVERILAYPHRLESAARRSMESGEDNTRLLAEIDRELTMLARKRSNLLAGLALLDEEEDRRRVRDQLETLSTRRRELEGRKAGLQTTADERQRVVNQMKDLIGRMGDELARISELTHDEKRAKLSELGVVVRLFRRGSEGPRWTLSLAGSAGVPLVS